MLSRRHFTLAGLAWGTAGCGLDPAVQRGRLGLSSAHSKLEASAAKEAALRIDATTDETGLEDLLASFKRQYPQIALEYQRPPSRVLYTSFVQDVANNRPIADILISSAMDLQFKLVNDGFAQRYESPQAQALPSWAVWNGEAYALTAEPIGIAYNRRLMPPGDVPHSRDELADLLRRKPDFYRGKVATYDAQSSATGYLYYTQDLLLSRDTLDLAEAIGRTQPKFYVSGVDALNRIATGELLLAYNMVSSYILARAPREPSIGIVFPSDYTLVMSRIAVIPKAARHPAAAKLFLDFLLSEPGQRQLARRDMQPIRNGVTISGPAPPPEALRPIHFGPALLANQDEFRRRTVLREWHRAFGASAES